MSIPTLEQHGEVTGDRTGEALPAVPDSAYPPGASPIGGIRIILANGYTISIVPSDFAPGFFSIAAWPTCEQHPRPVDGDWFHFKSGSIDQTVYCIANLVNSIAEVCGSPPIK